MKNIENVIIIGSGDSGLVAAELLKIGFKKSQVLVLDEPPTMRITAPPRIDFPEVSVHDDRLIYVSKRAQRRKELRKKSKRR